MIRHPLRFAASISIFLAITSPAHATVGCTVTSSTAEAEIANLYHAPNETSEIIREIPQGDIVLYPAQELAPMQVDDWAWVRHDITQEDIWTSGIYGWMKSENISEHCG
ncbi:hypothetical protein [Kiloniella majae]|uniref:hypothetical protein n=1 Tax=Kiloniella majae TaxID=1938558 RepID=UPI000A277644|nr:hypothetical protein [Kiloniella majae]